MIPAELAGQLRRIVGTEHVLTRKSDLLVYECDAYTVERRLPAAVVLPGSTEEVRRVVRLLYERRIPFLPRGAGTGLSGGAVPLEGSVVIALTRMNRIQAVDFRNRLALVEAGVVNLRLDELVGARGYRYAPDPSSQSAATLGGNVAENAGGPHTLKYGVTSNHVVALELVLPDGRVSWVPAAAEGGYDLAGLICGSEGTLGLVTRALVRLVRKPQTERTLLAVFPTAEDATQCVSSIIAHGMIPAALEMIDQAAIQAVEDAFRIGLPRDAGAVLVVELDGCEAGIDEELHRVEAICLEHRSRKIRLAATPEERAELWRARRLTVAAMGRLAPSYIIQDGVVPRTKLPQILRHIAHVSRQLDVPIANVMHAGDGNVHPILLFDERDPEQVRRIVEASAAIVEECVRLGGTPTGEHGIGIEKAPFIAKVFNEADVRLMQDVRAAFDPDGLCNRGKIFPRTRAGNGSEAHPAHALP